MKILFRILRQILSNFELEEGLVSGGFCMLLIGLAGWLGADVALTIGGTLLFVLGLGLAIYKGTR